MMCEFYVTKAVYSFKKLLYILYLRIYFPDGVIEVQILEIKMRHHCIFLLA